MVELVASSLAGKKVGLIGTKRTVQSGIYARKIKEINPKQDICSLATPLLAPMIEEGFFNSQISHEIIANYLTDPLLNSIDALILACTHYPLIHQNLMNTLSKPVHHFMVSDFTESFEASTKIFFGHEIKLDWYPLWK